MRTGITILPFTRLALLTFNKGKIATCKFNRIDNDLWCFTIGRVMLASNIDKLLIILRKLEEDCGI